VTLTASRAIQPAGRLVCVVGPSGAGKDTLIDLARAECAGDPRFVFVQRLITRPPRPGERHQPIDEAAYACERDAGAYALYWRAHGLGYAVPATAAQAIAEGRVVVCDLSRAALAGARSRFPASVVLVTAPAELRAERIAARGREDVADARARLERSPPAQVEADLAIENIGPAEHGAARLAAFLRSLA